MRKFLSIILTVVMCFTMVVPAFAGEAELSKEKFTLADAAKILGVNEEELDGMKIQRLPSLGNSNSEASPYVTDTPIPEDLQSGYVYYEDITIKSSFTGAMHYVKGTKYMWGATVRTWKGNGRFGIQQCYGDGAYPSGIHFLDSQGDRYDSGWIDESYNRGIYFKYYLTGQYISGTKTIRIVVAVH